MECNAPMIDELLPSRFAEWVTGTTRRSVDFIPLIKKPHGQTAVNTYYSSLEASSIPQYSFLEYGAAEVLVGVSG